MSICRRKWLYFEIDLEPDYLQNVRDFHVSECTTYQGLVEM